MAFMTEGIKNPITRLGAIFYGTDENDLVLEQKQRMYRMAFDIVAWGEGFQDGKTYLQRFYDRLHFETKSLQKKVAPEEEDLVDGLLTCLANPGWWTEPDPHGHLRQHGIYDHFKGGVYRVTKIAMFANGELFVDYISMTTGQDFGRFVSEWCEVVRWPDGRYRSRFVWRSAGLLGPEPTFKVPTPSPKKH